MAKKHIKNSGKKKVYTVLKVLVIVFVAIQLFYVVFIGIDNKKVVPNVNCSSSLLKVGTVEGVNLYTYCIEDIKFLKNDGNYDSQKQFLKGTHFESFIWDGGSRVYRGKNYYITECNELKSKPVKYIISSLESQNEAWKHCHTTDEDKINSRQ